MNNKFTTKNGNNYYYIGRPYDKNTMPGLDSTNYNQWNHDYYQQLQLQHKHQEAYEYANMFVFEDPNIKHEFEKTIDEAYTFNHQLKAFMENATTKEEQDKYKTIFLYKNGISIDALNSSNNKSYWDNEFAKDVIKFSDGFYGDSNKVKVTIGKQLRGENLGWFEWFVRDYDLNATEYLNSIGITQDYLNEKGISLNNDEYGNTYFIMDKKDNHLDVLMKLKKDNRITFNRMDANGNYKNDTSDNISNILAGINAGISTAFFTGYWLYTDIKDMFYSAYKDPTEWIYQDASYYAEELQDTWNSISKVYDDQKNYVQEVIALYDYTIHGEEIENNYLDGNSKNDKYANHIFKTTTPALNVILNDISFNNSIISEQIYDGEETANFHTVNDIDRKKQLYNILSSSDKSTISITPIVRKDGVIGSQSRISSIQSKDSDINTRNKDVLEFRVYNERNNPFSELSDKINNDVEIQGQLKKYKIDSYNTIHKGINNEIYTKEKGYYKIGDDYVDETTFTNKLSIDLASKQIAHSLANTYLNIYGTIIPNKEKELENIAKGAAVTTVNSIMQDGDIIESLKYIFGNKVNTKDPESIYNAIFELASASEKTVSDEYINMLPVNVVDKLNLIYFNYNSILTEFFKYTTY